MIPRLYVYILWKARVPQTWEFLHLLHQTQVELVAVRQGHPQTELTEIVVKLASRCFWKRLCSFSLVRHATWPIWSNLTWRDCLRHYHVTTVFYLPMLKHRIRHMSYQSCCIGVKAKQMSHVSCCFMSCRFDVNASIGSCVFVLLKRPLSHAACRLLLWCETGLTYVKYDTRPACVQSQKSSILQHLQSQVFVEF